MSTALLLLDLQVGLCTPPQDGTQAPLAEAVAERNVLAAASGLLEAARSRNIDVIHVRLAFDLQFGNRTNRSPRFNEHEHMRRFLRESPATQFCEEATPVDGDLVFEKGSVGPFASTPLETALRARGIDRLVIGGVATHLAVESTVREAADRGFAIVVAEDVCAAPTEHLHRAAIEETLPLFAQVSRSAEILPSLK